MFGVVVRCCWAARASAGALATAVLLRRTRVGWWRSLDATRVNACRDLGGPTSRIGGGGRSHQVTFRIGGLACRVAVLDWDSAAADLDDVGVAAVGPILRPGECDELRAMYFQERRFRSTIDMARHRFGEGEYRYFARPLPPAVAELRGAFWAYLRPIAREWAGRLGRPAPWPDDFDAWIAECHDAGQVRPTPLMLRYGPGDWNALHRDLYGPLAFPLQVVIGLDSPGDDYTGGEFVVVEHRPRGVTSDHPRIREGTALCSRPGTGRSGPRGGWAVAQMRHGVSTLQSGRRHTLGLVFHDAS